MILLTIATMIWGMGFVAVKWALPLFSPLWTNSLRFFFAGLIALPVIIYFKSYKRSFKELFWPIVAGFCLFLAMTFQTIGLLYTTVAKSGFITCLYALFTPLFAAIFFKKKISRSFWILSFVALSGIFLMCELQFKNFNMGDFLTFVCSMFAALQIIAVEKTMGKIPSGLEMNSIQLLIMALLSIPAIYFFESPTDLSPFLHLQNYYQAGPVAGIIFMGLFSSFLAFWIQAHAQKTIEAHVASLIFLLESPFAAIWGRVFLKESLTPLAIFGSSLVLISIASLPFIKNKKLKVRKQKIPI